jgi:hypothetical protein
VRHLPFLLIVALYVLVIGQNWGFYTAAFAIATYRRYDGRWNSVPFKLG